MVILGIMTHRPYASARYTKFAKEAERLGFRGTLLFAPNDARFAERTIAGYLYAGGRWRRRVSPFPAVAHDFGFYSDPLTIRNVKRMKYQSGVNFTGFALGDKWTIHEKLQHTPFADYVPETLLLRRSSTAMEAANRHGAVMIKPTNGKQGKGIVKLSNEGGSSNLYVWKESDRPERRLDAQSVRLLLSRRFRAGKAVVQRWMDIRDPRGGVFDIRALVQKDLDDRWRLTAMGIRQSEAGRIASNVSDGGSVREPIAFLSTLYGEEESERIVKECALLALALPETLEESYKKPFLELGIDLAVERGGFVRLIEVNIKPGKKIVRALSGEEAYADAVLLPVRYAKRLSDLRDFPSKGS